MECEVQVGLGGVIDIAMPCAHDATRLGEVGSGAQGGRSVCGPKRRFWRVGGRRAHGSRLLEGSGRGDAKKRIAPTGHNTDR